MAIKHVCTCTNQLNVQILCRFCAYFETLHICDILHIRHLFFHIHWVFMHNSCICVTFFNIFSAYFVQICYISLHMVCISSASWYFVHTLHNCSILACYAYFAHISYIGTTDVCFVLLFCFPCPGVEIPSPTSVIPVCAFSHEISCNSCSSGSSPPRIS